MDGPEAATWFAGDLGDPWVGLIAAALPRQTFRIDCPGDLPEAWPIDRATPAALVLHRSNLNATDAQRLNRLKSRADRTPRIVLCLGPQARYAEVERWTRLVDVILPEATASETVLHHALNRDRRAGSRPRPKIVLISTNHELRTTLADLAQLGGYPVEPLADPVDAPTGLTRVWDVPVLEPGWPGKLANLAKEGPVVALLGFADRQTVTQARRQGAVACLDLPCEAADLWAVLDRVTAVRVDPGHDLPPTPAASRGPSIRQGVGMPFVG